MKIKERVLKVEAHYSPRPCGESVYSRIRLKGKWLEDAGFEPDDRVTVSVINNGEIQIKKVGQQ